MRYQGHLTTKSNMFPLKQLPFPRSSLYTIILGLSVAFPSETAAQVIGNWNFNNTNNGSGSTYNTASSAAFAPAVGSTAFNGGTEYYGHNGWPSGGLDPNYYLEFTLTPNTGYALNIQSLVLRIRHSNTGSSGGSGPKSFSVRSSLDSYSSDLSTGSISGSYATFTILPGATHNNVPIAVSFRVYGYNAVIYSGGNNRLVFDNIEVNAIGIVLPHSLISLTGYQHHESIRVNYVINNHAAGTKYTLERSVDANRFEVVNSHREEDTQTLITRQFIDARLTGNATKYHYRLLSEDPGGNLKISSTISVSCTVKARDYILRSSPGCAIVSGIFPDHCSLIIYNSAGIIADRKMLQGNNGFRTIMIGDKRHLPTGIYHISITPGTSPPRTIFIE
jgi:hypothetical protein